jgi:hypothetical protein
MPLVVARLGKTRKEEIVRFDKARLDVEFGKMLKARVLNPEQTELQTQLRRDIRVSGRHGERALRLCTGLLAHITGHPRPGHENGGSSTHLQKEAQRVQDGKAEHQVSISISGALHLCHYQQPFQTAIARHDKPHVTEHQSRDSPAKCRRLCPLVAHRNAEYRCR